MTDQSNFSFGTSIESPKQETPAFRLNRETLKLFIKKYTLGGAIEGVRWICKEKTLYTNFLTIDKSLLGIVKLHKVDGENFELGVYNTSSLEAFLNIFSDTSNELHIKLNYTPDKARIASVDMADEITSATFVASDPSVVPAHKGIKEPPPYIIKTELSEFFIKSYIKSCSALSEIKQAAIINNKGTLKLVLGYSKNNTSKISLDITHENVPVAFSKPIFINASHLKEIFGANMDVKHATLNITEGGICNVAFNTPDWSVEYYLVGAETQQL